VILAARNGRDAAAFVNCSGAVSSADIILLVNVVFKGANLTL
jgi:hypothetical protein